MAREGIVHKRGGHKRQRTFPGARGPAPHHKAGRVAEAQERQAAWAKLSPQEQLKLLDRRPGGSKRQRARLEAAIDRAKHRPKVEASVVASDSNPLKAKDRRAQEQKGRPGR